MLPRLLGVEDCRDVYLVGGGGKTTTMFALAHELSRRVRVITTTSTRIARPEAGESPAVAFAPDAPHALASIAGRLGRIGHMTLAREVADDGKLLGFSVEVLESLRTSKSADVWLVEADGSAGRLLKAHAHYEPVVSAGADRVIALVGAGIVGRPLDDAHVHRSVLAAERLGKALGEPVTAQDVARLVLHPEGYLRGSAAPATLFVVGHRDLARELARTIGEADRTGRIDRTVVGNLRGDAPWVESL